MGYKEVKGECDIGKLLRCSMYGGLGGADIVVNGEKLE